MLVRITLVASLALAYAACSAERTVDDPDPLVEMLVAQCEQWRRCACEHRTTDACEPYAAGRAMELRQFGADHGATLDEDCADANRRLAEIQCRDGYARPYTTEQLTLQAEAQACKLFHGDRAEGETCEYPHSLPSLSDDDCDEGLTCWVIDDEARCGPWFQHHLGDPCHQGDVESSCRVDQACVLVSASDSVCQPMMQAGDPCGGWQHDYCEGPPGLYCDEVTGRCKELPDAGEACLLLDGGRRTCRPDHDCDDDGRCRLRSRVGEACDGFGDCVSDLTCSDGVCVGTSQAC